MAKKIAFSLFGALIGLWIVSPIILPIELKANLYNHEARIDIYNQGNLENSVVVQSDDKKVSVSYPEWLQKISWIPGGGSGASLSLKTASSLRTANFQIKSKGNGQVVIKLMGPDYKRAGKRIPIWIDYQEVMINGLPAQNIPVVASHDKSQKITLNAQDGEVFDVSVKHQKHALPEISGFYYAMLINVFLFILLLGGFWYGYQYLTQMSWKLNRIFIGIMLPFSLLCIIFFLTNENGYFSSGYGNVSYFCDFFEPVIPALGLDAYNQGSQNPPLLNILYYLFGQTGGYADRTAFEAFHQTGNYAKAHLFIFMMAMFLLLVLFNSYKETSGYKYCLMCILMASLPFSNAVSTGNPMILAVTLTTVYLFNYNSENSRDREVALICLGIAAGLKMYPCIFGLLTLCRGNLKETLRLVIYGLVFVFLPFLFFKGGFANIPLIAENTMKYNTGMWTYFSFRYLIYANAGFGGVLKGDLTRLIGNDGALLADKFIIGLNCILAFSIFVTNCFQKIRWKQVTQLVLLILTIISNRSYPYFGLYLFACVVMFLNQAKLSKLNLIYLLLFVNVLNPLKILNNDMLRAVSAHLMLLLLTGESVICFLKSDKAEIKNVFKNIIGRGEKNV